MTRFRRGAVVAAVLTIIGTALADDQQIVPRTPTPKTPTTMLRMPSDPTGRLIIKFVDQYRARATEDGNVVSATNLAMDETQRLIAALQLVLTPAFRRPQAFLTALETRAREYSGREQPDLGGVHYVDAPAADLVAAARALNDLEAVEWVVIEEHAISSTPPAQPDLTAAPGALGMVVAADAAAGSSTAARLEQVNGDGPANPEGPQACCLPPESGSVCTLLSAFDCAVIGGTPWSGTCDASGFCGACCLPEACADSWIESQCVAVMGASYAGDRLRCSDFGACPPGACCLPNEECVQDFTEGQCLLQGGQWLPNALCEDVDCESDCGQVPGSCFRQDGNIAPYCADEDCCNLICDLDDFCCDDEEGGWDYQCSAIANILCDDPARNWNSTTEEPSLSGDAITAPDRCASWVNGECGVWHGTSGCRDQLCCNRVCDEVPGCCSQDGDWDSVCVAAALILCGDDPVPPSTPTPDFSPLQGYLTPEGYPFPPPPVLRLPFFPGWGGGGHEVGQVHDLAEDLLDLGIDATGQGNLTRGKDAKIAVVGRSYWEDHEDIRVRLERGQSMIPLPDNAPDDNTAMLSVLGGRDNGRGVVGMVPEAKLFFFPTVSIEEGAREPAAWISAITELSVGDVLVASYWYTNNNLNTSPAGATWLRMARDSGITCCVPAGDRCENLDGFFDAGDTGAIVVGGSSPGAPWYRLGTTRYSTSVDPSRGNIVHVRSWGAAVVAAGFGDLFVPDDGDINRAYTKDFSSSVAATSIVGGLATMLQGVGKQFYGTGMPPFQIRNTLMINRRADFVPTRRLLNGNNAEQGCLVDFDEDGGQNFDGWFPAIRAAAGDLLFDSGVGGFVDAPLVDDVVIVRGTAVTGNRYSIKGLDGLSLGLNSLETDRNEGPQGFVGLGGGTQEGLFIPEIEQITYLASGQITDIVVVAHADFFDVNLVAVQVFPSWSPVFDILFAELYDWRRQRWESIGVIVDGPPEDQQIDVTFAGIAPQRFVRDGDNRILTRLWTLGFTSVNIGGETVSSDYRWEYDLIDVFANEEIGEEIP